MMFCIIFFYLYFKRVNILHNLRTNLFMLKSIIGMAKCTDTLCHEFTFFLEFAWFRVSIYVFAVLFLGLGLRGNDEPFLYHIKSPIQI